jgi:hypothetical protein
MPFGVLNAPLVYNLSGLAIQIAPVVFFMSNRFRKVAPSIWVRAALCGVYLLIPSGELQISNNDAQFHLAVLAALVLIAPPSPRWWGRAFDVATVAFCALTGGCVFVLVVAANAGRLFSAASSSSGSLRSSILSPSRPASPQPWARVPSTWRRISSSSVRIG